MWECIFDCFIFYSTSTYNIMSVRWYVPCSDKYPRWNSIFRIQSVELWLVLIISIVIAAISTTLVGRYTCTSEWQGYKTLTISLIKVWALILGGVCFNDVSRTVTTFAVRWLGVFICGLLHSVPVISHNVFIDSCNKTLIRNMDALFAPGIKFAHG